jgi:hypothetical protein
MSTAHGVEEESGAQYSWPSTHFISVCAVSGGTIGSALELAFSFVHVVMVLSPVMGIP